MRFNPLPTPYCFVIGYISKVTMGHRVCTVGSKEEEWWSADFWLTGAELVGRYGLINWRFKEKFCLLLQCHKVTFPELRPLNSSRDVKCEKKMQVLWIHVELQSWEKSLSLFPCHLRSLEQSYQWADMRANNSLDQPLSKTVAKCRAAPYHTTLPLTQTLISIPLWYQRQNP